MAQPTPAVYGMLREWHERRCPELTRGQRRRVAKLVCAVVEAGACTQPALATALQRLGLSRATCESGQIEIRRVLRDPGLTVSLLACCSCCFCSSINLRRFGSSSSSSAINGAVPAGGAGPSGRVGTPGAGRQVVARAAA